MAEVRKVLGQAALSATILTDVYTVPAGKQAVISSIFVCNRSNSLTSFRISVAVLGAADDNKQYIYYDVIAPGGDTFATTTGITLNSGDVVRAYSPSSDLTVNLYGVEL